MDEYINKQDVIEYFLKQADLAYQEFEICGGEAGIETETLYSVADELSNFAAADVAPVRHGRWEETDLVELEDGGNELVRTPNAALRCSNCPNCGARMDGGDSDEAD